LNIFDAGKNGFEAVICF